MAVVFTDVTKCMEIQRNQFRGMIKLEDMFTDVTKCMAVQRNQLRGMIKLEVQELYMGSVNPSRVCMRVQWRKEVYGFVPWYSKYQGFLPWYWLIVMSTTKNIDPVKEYHRHNYGFDPWYWKMKKLYKEVKINALSVQVKGFLMNTSIWSIFAL